LTISAPLALFVYNRPRHTARTIAALKASDGFAATSITVFSDGAKLPADEAAVAAVRALVASELPNATLVAASANQGLARSIIAGTSNLVGKHGRIIVLEDDLLVAPDFLTYINEALDRYADEPQVMQVSGHMFDVVIGNTPIFLPFVTSWGWGTWARAWSQFDAAATGSERLGTDIALRRRFNLDGAYDYYRMLDQQRAGRVDSWAIRWYWSVFKIGGLVLYPPQSRIHNNGFDSEATHTHRPLSTSVRTNVTRPRLPIGSCFPTTVSIDKDGYLKIKRYLRSQNNVFRRLSGSIAAVLRAARAAR
jgi:hypothetical protein